MLFFEQNVHRTRFDRVLFHQRREEKREQRVVRFKERFESFGRENETSLPSITRNVVRERLLGDVFLPAVVSVRFYRGVAG